MSSKQVQSRERVADYGEVFTAKREVEAMLDLVKGESVRLEATFLEPSCGTGNFMVAILKRKLNALFEEYSGRSDEIEKRSLIALAKNYGIEIQADNVAVCRRRLFECWRDELKSAIRREPGEETAASARDIIEKNVVLGNFLTQKKVDENQNDLDEPIIIYDWIVREDGSMVKKQEILEIPEDMAKKRASGKVKTTDGQEAPLFEELPAPEPVDELAESAPVEPEEELSVPEPTEGPAPEALKESVERPKLEPVEESASESVEERAGQAKPELAEEPALEPVEEPADQPEPEPPAKPKRKRVSRKKATPAPEPAEPVEEPAEHTPKTGDEPAAPVASSEPVLEPDALSAEPDLETRVFAVGFLAADQYGSAELNEINSDLIIQAMSLPDNPVVQLASRLNMRVNELLDSPEYATAKLKSGNKITLSADLIGHTRLLSEQTRKAWNFYKCADKEDFEVTARKASFLCCKCIAEIEALTLLEKEKQNELLDVCRKIDNALNQAIIVARQLKSRRRD